MFSLSCLRMARQLMVILLVLAGHSAGEECFFLLGGETSQWVKVTESSSSDIIIDDTAGPDRARPSGAGRSLLSPALTLLMLLLMSEALGRI